jgi:hypothetical protein
MIYYDTIRHFIGIEWYLVGAAIPLDRQWIIGDTVYPPIVV